MTHDLLDWRGTARRLARVGLVLLAVAGVVLGASWAVTGRLTATGAARWLGVAALLLVAGTVVTVTRAALRGMLRAGDRGERLSEGDVGLLPPQVRPDDRSRR